MAIEATYALNEYLRPFLLQIEPTISFIPGNSSPESAGHNFILYNCVPAVNYDILALHEDTIIYKITNIDFNTKEHLVSAVLKHCNLEDPEGILQEPKIRYQHLFAYGGGSGNDYYTDTTEYYYTIINVDIMYTLNGPPDDTYATLYSNDQFGEGSYG